MKLGDAVVERYIDIVQEIAQLVRGSQGRGHWLHMLGSEPDDFGFAEIVLSHGLTQRILDAADGKDLDGSA